MKWDGHEIGQTWNGMGMKWDRHEMAYLWHELGLMGMKWDGNEKGRAWIRTVGHEMGWTWNGTGMKWPGMNWPAWIGPTWNGRAWNGINPTRIYFSTSSSLKLVIRTPPVFICCLTKLFFFQTQNTFVITKTRAPPLLIGLLTMKRHSFLTPMKNKFCLASWHSKLFVICLSNFKSYARFLRCTFILQDWRRRSHGCFRM